MVHSLLRQPVGLRRSEALFSRSMEASGISLPGGERSRPPARKRLSRAFWRAADRWWTVQSLCSVESGRGTSTRAAALLLALQTLDGVTNSLCRVAVEREPERWIDLFALRSMTLGEAARTGGVQRALAREFEGLLGGSTAEKLGALSGCLPGLDSHRRLDALQEQAAAFAQADQPLATLPVALKDLEWLEQATLELLSGAFFAWDLPLEPAVGAAPAPVRWAVVAALHARFGP